MSPFAPDTDTAMRMIPLFSRGREALRVFLLGFEAHERPIGGALIDVVTRADFVANVELCLKHVEVNGAPTHVLCESGAICVLIERRAPGW